MHCVFSRCYIIKSVSNTANFAWFHSLYKYIYQCFVLLLLFIINEVIFAKPAMLLSKFPFFTILLYVSFTPSNIYRISLRLSWWLNIKKIKCCIVLFWPFVVSPLPTLSFIFFYFFNSLKSISISPNPFTYNNMYLLLIAFLVESCISYFCKAMCLLHRNF